jgi:hypothetical protein
MLISLGYCEQRIEKLLLDKKPGTKIGAAASGKINDKYPAEFICPLFKSLSV